MSNIWGTGGKLIGNVQDHGKGNQTVYDSQQQPIGKVAPTGTFDQHGTKISSVRDSGLVFNKK